MKRTFFAALLLAFSTTFAFAQKDAKAKDVLDKSSEKYAQAGGISANFTLNIKNIKTKLTESFDGSILMKDSKFYLSTPDADTWFDGKTQWVYFKASGEVNISEPSDRDVQMMNPAAIFAIYKAGCNYKYNGDKTDIKKRPVSEIELMPLDKKSDIAKIVVQINKADFIPVMFHVFYKNQLENIVYINKYQTGVSHPNSTFVFNKANYPKAEIIDLR